MSIKLTQRIRETGKKIVLSLREHGELTYRKLAERVGCSKSAAHRHLNAMEKRDRHPESFFWETEEGQAWLRILIFATLYLFGLQRGVGPKHISLYFSMLRLDWHVGVSESALRTQLQKMEALLPEFQRICEQQQAGKQRKAVLAGDETFFGELMLLVLMDLSSGYLLLEEVADDRSFETWLEKAKPRLEALNIEVTHVVTDRAKALIKLALDGFECNSGADTFHAVNDISKALGAGFQRSVKKAQKEEEASKAKLDTVQEKKAPKAEIDKQKQRFEQDAERRHVRQKGQEKYQDTLQDISEAIHPFAIEDDTKQTSAQVEKRLQEQARQLEESADLHKVEDRRGGVEKFRKQIKALACGVDAWWIWALESASEQVVGKEQQEWLLYSLLPVFYWHRQMEKSQNARHRRQYAKAWKRALATWQAHPLSTTIAPDQLRQWQAWAEWMCEQFHRSSSAVEGRNGCLAQMYHCGRGLTQKRLAALTVIHNFGLKRADGTTAAERFFGTQFPDLFEWLMEQMGPLPLPRKGRVRAVANPLNLELVPA